MKNKKGFTLVELLAVIAILAILVIIALPNILEMYNNARKNAFETEVKNIYSAAEKEWINDSLNGSGEKIYSHCNAGNCGKDLKLNGGRNLEYYIEFDTDGKVVKYFATNGNYQYRYIGEGLKATEINNIEFIPDIPESNKVAITSDGVDANIIEICVVDKSWDFNNVKYIQVFDGTTVANSGYPFVIFYKNPYINCIKSRCVNLTNAQSCLIAYSINSFNSNINLKLEDKTKGCYSINSLAFPKPADYTCGSSSGVCLDGETEVWVYDKKKKKKFKKKIKDVTYDDLVLAWDFDKGEYVWVKPFWIMVPFEIGRHLLLTFSDGSTLKVISDHKIFDYDEGRFVSSVNCKIGLRTFNSDGEIITLVSKKNVKAPSLACNVITEKHMNIFANGILTSRGSNNLYKIENMKFVKEERETILREELDPVDDIVYENLRLGERPINMYGSKEVTIKHLNELVIKILTHKK